MHGPSFRNRGMTLFELAVVATIAVILVGLGLYSTQSLINRTKVSRVQEEQRAISRALQNYMLDYTTLPPSKTGLRSLTRPTAYLGSVPRDPFQGEQGGYLYLMPDSHEVAALIISPGPDGDFDLPEELWRFAATKDIKSDLIPVKKSRMAEFSGLAGFNAPGEQQKATGGLTETEAAILSTYLRLGRYDPSKGEDGDIITVIRF